MIGLTYPPQRGTQTQAQEGGWRAHLRAMVSKRLDLPRSSKSPHRTILLLGRTLEPEYLFSPYTLLEHIISFINVTIF